MRLREWAHLCVSGFAVSERVRERLREWLQEIDSDWVTQSAWLVGHAIQAASVKCASECASECASLPYCPPATSNCQSVAHFLKNKYFECADIWNKMTKCLRRFILQSRYSGCLEGSRATRWVRKTSDDSNQRTFDTVLQWLKPPVQVNCISLGGSLCPMARMLPYNL